MLGVPVMDVGQSFKTRSQPLPHILPAFKTGAVRLIAPWHLQNAIIGKETHDPIQIVRVKRIAYLYQLGSNIHLRLARLQHAAISAG
jgi:hypothetical protein